MKKILFFCFAFVFFSCSSDINHKEDSTVIESTAILKIKNSNGENFLNLIEPNNTELYYEKNGNLNLISYNWDHPKGFLIVQEPPVNEKLIKIFCYIESNKTSEKTFVKWSNNDIDTISYNISKFENGIIIKDLKYNSVSISNKNEYGIYEIRK